MRTKSILFLIAAIIALATNTAMAQGNGEFWLNEKDYDISSVDVSLIGQGGNGYIWSFTASEQYGDKIQLYLTNDNSNKLAGTRVSAYNDWKHSYVWNGREYSYTYPNVQISQSNGYFKIHIQNDILDLNYQGYLDPGAQDNYDNGDNTDYDMIAALKYLRKKFRKQ